jgi:hypothetical protein
MNDEVIVSGEEWVDDEQTNCSIKREDKGDSWRVKEKGLNR